ncbi:hypothetical protein EUGRSUZ_K01272 [Eucalyptus grandis]|uniref:Aspartate aminotransferase n=2 Tax=Eucalyptus grandis TaxID=71139 RepID=A0A059A2F5_EUCGR|nr:hypothetical protein EUGRSUZ_K01272 [Eucalyptus grandis]
MSRALRDAVARRRVCQWWDHVRPAPKDPIASVGEAFQADASPNKINLGVGAYRDEEGKPVVLRCVRNAEAKVAGSEFLHHSIWKDAEVPQGTFSYYNPKSKGLNFPALIDDIKNAPESSFFLLHPCAHNPTGVDPTEEEWREISYHLKVKNHFPFFDMAYQGFSSGDLDRDARAIRTFLQDGHLIGCAQSFAKNMGLYGHRVGCLSILCTDTMQALAVKSQLQQIARAMYGSPPIHGVLLVSTILGDPDTKALWVEELRAMVNRICKMREALQESLEKLGSPLNWEHITNQVGMFCFSGLTPQQIEQLQREYHIYMTADGRISMAGVTMSNMDYLANAIHEVTKSGQES